MTSGTVLLAHQGGWDEILLVAAPVALFVLLLWVANARAARGGSPRTGGAASRTDVDDTGRR